MGETVAVQDSRRLKNFCVHFGNNVYTHAPVVANVTNLHKCCHSPSRRLTDSAFTTTENAAVEKQILQKIEEETTKKVQKNVLKTGASDLVKIKLIP